MQDTHSTRPHFHVSHNVAGYMPESEDAAYPFETLRDALGALADELARYADGLYDTVDSFALPEDRTDDEDVDEANAVEAEGDRVHELADAIERVASSPHAETSLTLEGEPYPLDGIARGGLSIGVEDPAKIHDLGVNYHLLPCDELECAEDPETRDDTTTTPRAWVGCLGCYNAGRLIGEWVDGLECDDPEAWRSAGLPILTARTAETTSPPFESIRCARCGSDEWWVFDHEGYGALIPGECSPAGAFEAAELLKEIDPHERDAFDAFLGHYGSPITLAEAGDAVEAFHDAYCGEHDSERAFAEHLAEEFGWFDVLERAGINAGLLDVEAYARDLFCGDYYAEAVPGDPCAVYVFRTV